MRSLRIKDDYEVGNMHKTFDHLKKAFGEAKSPMQPYTFEILGSEADEVEEQTLTNEKTNEEFSIQKTPTHGLNKHKIEVKRVAKKKDGIRKNEFKV